MESESHSDDMKRICVLSGIHRGAVVSVGSHPVLVGGSDDCDALISDDAASDSAFRVSLEKDGRLSATPIRGSVLKNGRAMRVGRSVALADGVVVGLGDVRIAMGDDLAEAQRSVNHSNGRRTLLRWGAACAAFLALFGFLGAVGGPADAYNAAQMANRTIIDSTVASMTRSDPVSELEREIERRGLSRVVVIERTPSGQILAKGNVSASERERWNAVAIWFDGQFGDRMMLETRLAEREDGIVLPFEIVSIVSTPNPRITIQNGKTFAVGSTLPGGWEVRRIAGAAVVLARGERELAIAF